MASKQFLFRSEAREKILHGATALADAVRVTLGPKSKCVLIEKRQPGAAPADRTRPPRAGCACEGSGLAR